MIEATTRPRLCQVRSQTDLPCSRPAAVTVLGVLLCERCAREQEGYFAVGELTRVPRGQKVRGPEAATRATRTCPSKAAGRRRRRLWERVTGGKGFTFLAAVAVATSVLAAAGCAGTEQARAGAEVADPKPGQKTGEQNPTPAAEASVEGDGNDPAVARAGDVEARAGGGAEARAGNAKAGTGGPEARTGGAVITGNVSEGAGGTTERKDGAQEITLTVTGKPGTKFSGTCSVGGEERTLSGRAPAHYAFEPRAKKLECEVRKDGGGALSIVFADGEGVRSEQRTDAVGGTMKFVYSGGGIVASSSSSVTVEQTATSSDGSSRDPE